MLVLKRNLRLSLVINGENRDKNHMSWFSKVIYGSLWLLTERTWDKKHKCWFSKEIYGYLWLLTERTGIKIIWVGSPKLFTVLFGYSTDGSGIKIIWVCSQKIINGSLWLFTEGIGIKIIVFGYQELNYWCAAVFAEIRCLVSSLISSFTDSWCFFCKILDFFWIFLPRKGDFNKREERAMIFSKEPLT